MHGMPAASTVSSSFCNKWTVPPSTIKHPHKAQKLKLVILMECSSSIPPDGEGKAILQMRGDAPMLILRTSHDAMSPNDSCSHLHPLLEGDVASILSDMLDVSPPLPTHLPRKLMRLCLEIVDENPTLQSKSLEKKRHRAFLQTAREKQYCK